MRKIIKYIRYSLCIIWFGEHDYDSVNRIPYLPNDILIFRCKHCGRELMIKL